MREGSEKVCHCCVFVRFFLSSSKNEEVLCCVLQVLPDSHDDEEQLTL